jgi:ATP-binding cassette subfamily F protein 3
LDEYANWVKEQESTPETGSEQISSATQKDRPASKKQNRQADAKRRQLLKPHLDSVRQTESQIEKLKTELNQLDLQLADESLYTDPERVKDIQQWTRRQMQIRTEIGDLEWQWLEASEKLEHAQLALENGE